MMADPGCQAPSLSIVVLGLSITSSWGNGHATTYRALLKALHQRGHDVLFLERDMPWYRANRDMPCPAFARTRLYESVEALEEKWSAAIRDADLVILGSYVPDGIAVGDLVGRLARGVTAFYDIDTPVTLAGLAAGTCDYLDPRQVPRFDLYLSFTGGPTLALLQERYGARRARPLYCAVDPQTHAPEALEPYWELGYLGTYSPDRQPTLDRLLTAAAQALPASRFVVAGPQYPDDIAWPENVDRIEHLPPNRHSAFYCRQRFTLNVTRADMIRTGYSPSVRLFEAAAACVPIISDAWAGIEDFLAPGSEILIARSTEDALRCLAELPETERRGIAQRARARILSQHTAAHRAATLEDYWKEASVASDHRIFA
jgi:spore maturation protein CgeB